MAESTAHVGATLRGYELLGELGRGGFARVYRARQLATGVEVALKLIESGSADESLARFRREIEVSKRISHPHVSRLIDHGELGEGRIYAAFELVQGEDLAVVLQRENRLPPTEAFHLMVQVLDALGCAHKVGIVHRDVKPANILVSTSGLRRNAVVADFGLGALTDTDRSRHARLTGSRDLVGSPLYMSPEQLRSEDPSPQMDLYAWGLIFVECLSGKAAVQGSSLQEIISVQLGHEPISIPGGLRTHPLGRVLGLALAKDPRDRVRSAADLLEELDRIDPRTLTAALDTGTWRAPARLTGPGEKRQIALACCRLIPQGVGAEMLTPEDRDELTREVLSVVERDSRAHVLSVLGDRFMLGFGYPNARENDALSAVRAGLGLRAELRQLRWKHEGQYKVRLDLATGIHVGAVVARGRPDSPGTLDDLAGDTPEIAFRLSELAAGGEICLSETARDRIRSHYLCSPRGQIGRDGRPPVEAYELEGPAPSAELGLRHREVVRTTIAGRSEELALLRERWGRVASGGQTVWISGDPGIGKSRLVRELQGSLAGDFHDWLECACSEDATQAPLRPIADLVRSIVASEEGEDESERLEALLQRFGLTPATLMPYLGELLRLPAYAQRSNLDVDASRNKELVLSSARELLFALADRKPLVLLIEDIHWADPSTCEFIEGVLEQIALAPIFLLLTFRPEFEPRWARARALRLDLGPLRPEDERRMIEELLGEAGESPSVVRTLTAKAAGNPLFVEELARMALETSLLRRSGAGYEFTVADDQLEIPDTLQASLMARLDRLGPSRRMAEMAAVLGQEFSYALIQTAAGTDEHAVRRDLATLVEKEILLQRGRLPQVRFAFRHALIRDAAYQSLVRERRREMHARVASVLREHFSGMLEETPELLARHLEAAALLDQACSAWQRAARIRAASSAHAEASDQLKAALALLQRLPASLERDERELEIQVGICHSVGHVEGFASNALEQALKRARALSTKVGSARPTVSVIHNLSRFFQSQARYSESLEAAAAGRSLADADQDSILCQRIGLTTAFTLSYMGRLEEARQHLDSIVTDRSGDRVTSSSARAWLAWILGFMGLIDRARALIQENQSQTGDPVSVALTLAIGSDLDRYYGDHARAEKQSLALTELAQGRMRFWEAMGQVLRGAALCDLDQPLRGLDHARKGLDVWRAIGAKNGHSRFLSGAADIHARAGERDLAQRLVDEALQHADETGEEYYRSELYYLQGRWSLDARQPERGGAERRFEEAMHTSHAQGALLPELLAAIQLYRLRNAQGRTVEARAALGPVLAQFNEGLATPLLQEARELLA